MNPLLTQLNHPNVRQLFWCIYSQALAFGEVAQPVKVEMTQELTNWFNWLDENPVALTTFLKQSPTKRLGLYFEQLWRFYLTHAPHWQLLHHNVQIFQNKTTLGELDILAVNPTKSCVHIELAVKFYLLHPECSGLECHHWLGPQSRDRLDIKLETLNSKQFPILHHPQTQLLLEDLKTPLAIHQQLGMKGYLFHPWQTSYKLPPQVNAHCLLAEWLHERNITELTQGHDTWVIANKPQWLGPLKAPKDKSNEFILHSSKANQLIQDHFSVKSDNYALLLIKVAAQQDYFEEVSRYMVVSNHWPNI